MLRVYWKINRNEERFFKRFKLILDIHNKTDIEKAFYLFVYITEHNGKVVAEFKLFFFFNIYLYKRINNCF